MITLKAFERGDFDQLIEWVNTKELLTDWAGSLFSFPLTAESLEWYITDTNAPVNSDAFVYKVIDESNGKTIGHISLGAISRKNRSGRISRVLLGDAAYKGKGICKQMIRQILSIGFDELQLHRIGLGVYDDNHSAIRCYKSAGFVVEGVSRDVLWFNGRFRNLIEMSMLEDEWRGVVGSR